ncbi:hypothetical protein AAMO2058_001645700 [Amorphochlora amoebiformis]
MWVYLTLGVLYSPCLATPHSGLTGYKHASTRMSVGSTPWRRNGGGRVSGYSSVPKPVTQGGGVGGVGGKEKDDSVNWGPLLPGVGIGVGLGLLLSNVIHFIQTYNRPRPVVLMHGILSSQFHMNEVTEWLTAALPNVYVRQIEIGDGARDSLRQNMTWQVQEFAKTVKRDPSLRKGFDLIGYSQGALISRGYIERFNEPRVFNFFSWCGPQGGQFGVPMVAHPILKPINKRVSPLWYWEDRPIWGRYSWNDYWKDPHKMDVYIQKSTFLADVNNERAVKNSKYRDNIKSLENLVLIYSTIDKVIVPRESSWMYFFDPSDPERIQPLFETELFQEDWLGLKYLYDRDRLHFRRIVCSHLDVVRDVCKAQVFDTHTLPFLKKSNNRTKPSFRHELLSPALLSLPEKIRTHLRHVPHPPTPAPTTFFSSWTGGVKTWIWPSLSPSSPPLPLPDESNTHIIKTAAAEAAVAASYVKKRAEQAATAVVQATVTRESSEKDASKDNRSEVKVILISRAFSGRE